MNRKTIIVCLSIVILIGFVNVSYAASSIDDLTVLMDSARVAEAYVFAPKMYEKAQKKADKAQQAVKKGKRRKDIEGHVAEAMEYVENAIKSTEVARLTLNDYLPSREKAKKAQAPVLVPELYQKAEKQFINATSKVESGDVKGGLKEAEKSLPLFNVAEMEAIRVDILGTADKFIAAAVADEADKFALSTLDKARTARAKGDAILSQDRYNREEAAVEAKRAEYEARHASNIAQSVRSLNRNDQAWEKLMLIYEIQMNRIASEAGIEQLPFDDGPLAAADSLINYINNLKGERNELIAVQEKTTGQLKKTLGRMDYKYAEDAPVRLAEIVDSEFILFQDNVNNLREEVVAEKTKVTELTSSHEEVSAELQVRKEKEEKFKKAKNILNPSEGEVLFNASNDIVLRLGGLSFDVGKSDLKDEHMPLLKKVEEVIKMFPESKLVIEGHTDASGDRPTNAALSEKRAFSVMQYLRQSLLIPADRVRSIGYGDEKPIASNQTSEGRAKNRRIDIIIMR